MGLADVVPGVSGATIATLTGIYPRVLEGISRPRRSDWRLWCPLLLGVATAFVAGAHFFARLLHHPVWRRCVLGLFALLVLWAIVVCVRAARPWNRRSFLVGALGVALGVIGSFAMPQIGTGPLCTGVVGLLAAFALILPGLSGAAVVHLCGHYERALVAVTEGDWAVLGPLGLGMVLGVALFSRLAHYLYRKWPTLTMAFFAGCMVGALPLLQ